MPTFPSYLGAKNDKKGLSCTQSIVKYLGLIKFIPQCNLIDISYHIDEKLWIDSNVPL